MITNKRVQFTILILSLLKFQLTVADEGMWIPLLLQQQNEQKMKEMGMRINAEDIFSLSKPSLKDAVVIFGGGCTAEIVSPEGLILTNHHCGHSSIQSHSSLEHDYLANGFWAMNRNEELPNPGLTVSVLYYMENITEKILSGLDIKTTETERNLHISAKALEMIKSVSDTSHYQAKVVPYFDGNEYYLIVYEVFTDIRLVGAPPTSIGNFGGDTDNWVWPRHTGDFSVFRIYTGKDNKPAAYSSSNVPYKPKKFLNISLKGVEEGDFTFVYGFPGSTQEYLPSFAVELTGSKINPTRIDFRQKRLDIFNAAMQKSRLTRIQYAAKYSGVSNSWKKWIGENLGIRRLDVVENKILEEKSFMEWSIGNAPGYTKLLGEYRKVYSAYEPLYLSEIYLSEAGLSIEIMRFVLSFRSFVEKCKDPATTEESLQQSIKKMQSSATSFFKNYQVEIDKKVFVSMMKEYFKFGYAELLPPPVAQIRTEAGNDLPGYTDKIFNNSMFTSKDRLDGFLSSFSKKDYKKIEKDEIYSLAFNIAKFYNEELRPELSQYEYKIDSLQRLYMEGILQMKKGDQVYPDANGTMRISYGYVEGYYPKDAVKYNYFTTTRGILMKEDTAIFDYKVLPALKKLVETNDYGRYADKNGDMRTCFIASNHTTGGNSGSPVLNADGELVGINFDRCWEGTVSDIAYDRDICRNIALDIRYCLFVIEKIGGAGHLVNEMTIIN